MSPLGPNASTSQCEISLDARPSSPLDVAADFFHPSWALLLFLTEGTEGRADGPSHQLVARRTLPSLYCITSLCPKRLPCPKTPPAIRRCFDRSRPAGGMHWPPCERPDRTLERSERGRLLQSALGAIPPQLARHIMGQLDLRLEAEKPALTLARLELAASPAGITRVFLRRGASPSPARTETGRIGKIIAQAREELGEYFAGERTFFSAPVDSRTSRPSSDPLWRSRRGFRTGRCGATSGSLGNWGNRMRRGRSATRWRETPSRSSSPAIAW